MNQDERKILSSMMARLSSQITAKAFVIPKVWWDEWALFSSGLAQASSPPGPINNFSLLNQFTDSHRTPVQMKQVLMTVENSLTCFTDWEYYTLQLNLIPCVDYKIVSQEIWKYLLSHYGGGPEIPLYMMDEKMSGPTFQTEDFSQFYPDDSPLPIRLIYPGNQGFLSHKQVFSALMTVSLLFEESKRIVSQFLTNCAPSSLRVVIQDEEGKFIAQEQISQMMCLADIGIGANSDIYVLREQDGIRNEECVKKSCLIQISFQSNSQEAKEEYYEEGFFGSQTSFQVSEQFKQNFKSILKSPKFKDQNNRYQKNVQFLDQQDTQNQFDLQNQGFFEDQDSQLMRALEASLKVSQTEEQDSGIGVASQTPNKQFEMKLFKTSESNDCVIEMGEAGHLQEPTVNLVEVYLGIREEEYQRAREHAVESMQKSKLKFKRRSVADLSRRLSKLSRKLQNKY